MGKRSRLYDRDMGYNERHRGYGESCPMTNLDGLEFYFWEPIALIETKFIDDKWQFIEGFGRTTREAMKRLADRAELPAFCVGHTADMRKFAVHHMNRLAHAELRSFVQRPSARAENVAILGTSSTYSVRITERLYVAFLYHLRDLDMPEGLFTAEGVPVDTSDYDTYLAWRKEHVR
jgi:hypothetical protein